MLEQARLVKCLVLGQALFAGLVPTSPAYPLELPQWDERCFCSDGLNLEPEDQSVGWSSTESICSIGHATDCSECSRQRKCATISTLAGNGAEGFHGDCRTVGGDVCSTADKASLAFAVSLAIDEQDNLYIADQGNNRIRMMDIKTQTIVTIAGNGQYGFSGDGGNARNALMRQPEGVAVKPKVNVTEDGVGREIYFSDFKNQRIRKLVREALGWKIYTVAGTGTMGDNPLCDDGCNALTEATLWNPRALAFSSQQDLYFVDSGSHKIRKLSNTSLGDPSGQPYILSTFAGQNDWPSSSSTLTSFKGTLQAALPGHYKVKNENLQIRSLYFLTIDRHDKLWFIDTDNNRIFVSPLQTWSSIRYNGDFGGFQRKFVAADFLTDSETIPQEEDRQALAPEVAGGLEVWLPIEFESLLKNGQDEGVLFQVETQDDRLMENYSYWTYASPQTADSWCEKMLTYSGFGDERDCSAISAQFARFSSLTGLCVDQADNIYVVDAGASQIAYFEQPLPVLIDPKALPGNAKTAMNSCPCMKQWILEADGPLFGVTYLSELKPEQCAQNPSLTGPGGFGAAKNCTTTNYCGQVPGFGPSYPEICLIDTKADRSCDGLVWNFCGHEDKNFKVSWRTLPGAAILGNEKRFATTTPMTFSQIDQMTPYMTEDLWLTNNTAYWWSSERTEESSMPSGYFLNRVSVLVGYVAHHNDIDTTKCGGDYCCGLPKLPDSRSAALQADSSLCQFLSSQNITVVKDSVTPATLADKIYKVDMLWAELESLRTDQADTTGKENEEYRLVDLCKARCALDSTCSGFMARQAADSTEPRAISWGQPCVFFTENYPLNVFSLDRNKRMFDSSGNLNMSDPDKLLQAYDAFQGVENPKTRLTGSIDGVYVGTSSAIYPGVAITSSDVISRGSDGAKEALLLETCKDRCLENTECVGIAYPGCYLLRKTPVADTEANSPPGHFKPKLVFVKEFSSPKVKEAAGKAQVKSYYGDGDVIGQSLLARPQSCVVDSKGDLIVSDTWNQRIRRIAGYNPDCLALGGVRHGEAEAQAYMDAVNAVQASCDNASDPDMRDLYAVVQEQVLEKRNLTLVKSHFCSFGSSPNASFMEVNYTNNMIVLCKLCAEVVGPRPSVCPWETLCSCRSALVQVASTLVYQSCADQSAYVDAWHRWVTAYITCWTSSTADAAQWLVDNIKRTQLLSFLQSLSDDLVDETNSSNATNGTR
mmetsp:Transcript_12053/g.21393  ORF Transcript_12053/g.21393 Transcript_12053/m.21393 type:complete len:1218 (+) Transcript_12053:77-3730(+)